MRHVHCLRPTLLQSLATALPVARHSKRHTLFTMATRVKAEVYYMEALQVRRDLAKDNPRAYEPEIANTMSNLAILYFKEGRYYDAEKDLLEWHPLPPLRISWLEPAGKYHSRARTNSYFQHEDTRALTMPLHGSAEARTLISGFFNISVAGHCYHNRLTTVSRYDLSTPDVRKVYRSLRAGRSRCFCASLAIQNAYAGARERSVCLLIGDRNTNGAPGACTREQIHFDRHPAEPAPDQKPRPGCRTLHRRDHSRPWPAAPVVFR
jgi:hypothetical protein